MKYSTWTVELPVIMGDKIVLEPGDVVYQPEGLCSLLVGRHAGHAISQDDLDAIAADIDQYFNSDNTSRVDAEKVYRTISMPQKPGTYMAHITGITPEGTIQFYIVEEVDIHEV